MNLYYVDLHLSQPSVSVVFFEAIMLQVCNRDEVMA